MSQKQGKRARIAFKVASAISLVAGTICFLVWLSYWLKIDEYRLAVEKLAIVNCLFVSVVLFALCLVAWGLSLRTQAELQK